MPSLKSPLLRQEHDGIFYAYNVVPFPGCVGMRLDILLYKTLLHVYVWNHSQHFILNTR